VDALHELIQQAWTSEPLPRSWTEEVLCQVQSSHLSRQTKFTIHKTLIHSVLLYGSETWVLTKREENQLLDFEKKVLRTICGPKIKNCVYRRRYNQELDKEFNSPVH
jgi:hypothetical protein